MMTIFTKNLRLDIHCMLPTSWLHGIYEPLGRLGRVPMGQKNFLTQYPLVIKVRGTDKSSWLVEPAQFIISQNYYLRERRTQYKN